MYIVTLVFNMVLATLILIVVALSTIQYTGSTPMIEIVVHGKNIPMVSLDEAVIEPPIDVHSIRTAILHCG